MNVWPATLPQRAQVEGYQAGLGDGRLRSTTDAGGAKVRRRFSYAPRPLKLTMEMNADQLATFQTFVEGSLGGGVLPFQIPAQGEEGTWIVQLGQSMPQWSPISWNLWRVSLDLLVLS
ncbi:hypothetical protein [Consotaella salsifontis]|nr:hypothetical protein [Consotaella salsifontis]